MTISKDALLCVNQQKGEKCWEKGTTHRSSVVDIREEVIMAIQHKGNDLRVRRTRQLLINASREVLQEKGFSAVSIQEITGRAMVNRSTFYAHFTDKYELLTILFREQFQQAMARKLPSTSSWEPQTLLLLIEAVLDYFDVFYGHCQPAQNTGPIFEHATQEELYTLLLTWLRRDAENKRWQVPAETVAQIVSWGIFEAAVKWSHAAHPTSKKQITQDIFQVINEGTMHFFTKAAGQ